MAEYKLGVGLLPDEILRTATIELAKTLRTKHNTSYELGNETYPHLTLFQGKFENQEQVISAAEQLAETHRGISLTVGNLELWAETFVFLNAIPGQAILNLHYAAGDALRPLALTAKNSIAPIGIEQKLAGITDAEAVSLQRTGYPFALAPKPHWTIGRISRNAPFYPEEVDELVHGLLGRQGSNIRGYNLAAEKLIVYEAGIDGSCTNILKTIPML
ncbi:MAG: hypothetical protein HY438_01830 [DPANN group archaeon]|nr:hypothetical protein [DPANN group archaeon]